MNDGPTAAAAQKTPDAATALQWLKDALHEAARHTGDHGHVDFWIARVKAGKVPVDDLG